MKKNKVLSIFIIFIIIISTIVITPTFSKYISNIKVADLNLKIIRKCPARFQDATVQGGENVTKEVDLEQRKATYKFLNKAGAYEKLNIQLEGLEKGKFYQLYFNVYTDFIVDTTNYSYGCTVQESPVNYIKYSENINAMINFEHFTWKGLRNGSYLDQCISFYATSETMYWAWDLSAFSDGTTGSISLRILDFAEMPAPSTAYVDFPNAYFLHTENTDSQFSSDPAYASTPGAHNLVNSQGTFFTKATYNELLLRMETMKSKYEKIIVPIRNLTVGQQYSLGYNLVTEGVMNSNFAHGYTITGELTEEIMDNSHLWAYNDSNFVSITSNNQSTSTSFVATSDMMYMVFECSGLNDFQWTTMHFTNVALSPIDANPALLMFSTRPAITENSVETEMVNEVSNEIVNEVTNIISENTINNTVVTNVIDNSVSTTNTVNQNVVTNEIIENNEITSTNIVNDTNTVNTTNENIGDITNKVENNIEESNVFNNTKILNEVEENLVENAVN